MFVVAATVQQLYVHFFDFVFIQFRFVHCLFFPYLLFTVTSWIGVPNGFWREHMRTFACAFQFRFYFHWAKLWIIQQPTKVVKIRDIFIFI